MATHGEPPSTPRNRIKELTRFRKVVGHRIQGNRPQGRSAGVRYDRVHEAMDDTTRLPYVDVLPDEQQGRGGHSEQLLKSGNGLVQRPWRQVSSGHEQQQIGLHLQGLCQRLQRPQAQAHSRQALHATIERQGRAIH